MRVAHEADAKQEEVGAGERGGRAALGLPLERSGALGVGAQHFVSGLAPLLDHLPQPSRQPFNLRNIIKKPS